MFRKGKRLKCERRSLKRSRHKKEKETCGIWGATGMEHVKATASKSEN